MKTQRKRGIRAKAWWALVHHPGDLPVIFRTRAEAEDNKEPDEYVVRVYVAAEHMKDYVAPNE